MKKGESRKLDWRSNALPLAALFISLLSLVTGIYSQYIDRMYKELSIEPRLVENRYPSGLYVKFQNKGVGPAEIRRIIYQSKEGCSDLRLDNYESWPSEVETTALASIKPFLEKVFANVSGGIPKILHLKLSPPTPGTVFAVGEDFEFFSFYDAHDIFAAIGQENTGIALSAFGHEKLPFGFEYCSLTGKTCFGINMNYITKTCAIKY